MVQAVKCGFSLVSIPQTGFCESLGVCEGVEKLINNHILYPTLGF